ncbi:MAG: haloacid dehalogenase type II [Thermomicrobiales bacterium]
MAAIGFDVYGTLVDPLAMSGALEPVAGERAGEMATVWRTKQLEYSFRRALMGAYKNFDVCTRDALRYAARATGIDLGDDEERRLIDAYLDLEPYPDVISGIDALQRQGHALVAFSNGVESSLRALLSRSGVLEHLDGIVSVDGASRPSKPDPAVYRVSSRAARKPARRDAAGVEQLLGSSAHGKPGCTAWLRRDPLSSRSLGYRAGRRDRYD